MTQGQRAEELPILGVIIAHDEDERFRAAPGEPFLREILVGLALVWGAALGHKAQAAERFRQALELDQDFVDAWNNLGNVLAELGEADEAVEALEKALELDPDYGDAHYNLADVLDSQGRKEQAAEHWRSYLRQQPVGPWSDHARRRLRMDRA